MTSELLSISFLPDLPSLDLVGTFIKKLLSWVSTSRTKMEMISMDGAGPGRALI
jgi:hypothetical protein